MDTTTKDKNDEQLTANKQGRIEAGPQHPQRGTIYSDSKLQWQSAGCQKHYCHGQLTDDD